MNKVEGTRTVTRDVIVYSFKGLLEICRYSNQPKADAVMDFLWDIADEIRRKGYYIPQQGQAQQPQIEDESMKYLSRGIMSSAKKIFEHAFDCKEDKDYKVAVALDKVFKDFTGKSALDIAGIKLARNVTYKEVMYNGVTIPQGIQEINYSWEFDTDEF